MQYLKQSTACTIAFGPFVDKTDGVTLKTDATTITDIDHATTGIFLSKAGANAAVRHQNVTASVADDYGMMTVTLDTTDTATVGTLDVLFAKAATYLPVHKAFMVLPANVYDSLMGTDLLDVNQAQVLGTAVHASTEAGTQCVEVVRWGGNDIAATGINGTPVVDMVAIHGTALTETATQLAGAFTKFFNVAAPTGTVNSLPDAVAGVANGLQICGSNAATTYAILTVTAAFTTGSIVNNGVFTQTGTHTISAFTITNAFTTGSQVNNGVLTQTGAVTFSSTFTTGNVTHSAMTVTNALTTGSIVNNGVLTQTGTATISALTVTNALTTGSIVNNGVFTQTGTHTISALTVTNALTAGTNAIPWNAAWDAEVQSEVDDSLNTAIAELSQDVPPATPTVKQALMLLYMALRNERLTTDSLTSIKNDAGTVICKATLSDDGTTFTKAEFISGA